MERWRARASSTTASREPAAHETRGQCGTPGKTKRSSSEAARGPPVGEVDEAAVLGEAAGQRSSSDTAARPRARAGDQADGVVRAVGEVVGALDAGGRVRHGGAPHMVEGCEAEGSNRDGFEGHCFPVRRARTCS